MDLLFKRYASPILLLDNMIQVSRFNEFVTEFIENYVKEENDTKLWELYLHHAFLEQSFNDFKASVTKEDVPKLTEKELETTIINSKNILNDFIPQRTEV